MLGGKRSAVRRRGPLLLLVMLVVVATALVLTTGGTAAPKTAAAGTPGTIGSGGGYGEVYKANVATLKKTLFKATLLPKDPTARNIALAGFGRAEIQVNYGRGLKRWKNNGCSAGTGGRLTDGYIDEFGEHVYRQRSNMG